MKRLALISLLLSALVISPAWATCNLRQSTASQEVLLGPFFDDTDGTTAETALTIANTDVRISKAGANIVAKNSGGGTHDELGLYQITLDATDTNTVGSLDIAVAETGALAVWKECYVYEENVYDMLFASAADLGTTIDAVETDTQDLQTQIGTDGAGLTNMPWNASWDAEVQSESADALTAYDPPTNTELNARTLLAASYFDPAADTVANVTTVATTTTNTDMRGTDSALLAASAPTNFGDLSITATTGRVDVAAIAGTAQTANDNGADLNAVLADTNELQTDDVPGLIAALNDLSAAAVNAEVDTAIETYHLDHLLAVDYDPATPPGTATALFNEVIESDVGVSRFTANALEQAPTGGSAPTVAQIADGVWDEARSGHVTAGTFGEYVLADVQLWDGTAVSTTLETSADIADAVWDELQSGHTTAGSFGEVATEIAALPTTAEVNTEVDTALTDIHLDHLLAADYDPATKPGTATALLNEMVESDAGVSRYTANALENAPSGTGASAATIADAVWDEAQVDHTTAGSFGVVASEVASVLIDTNELQTDDVPGLIAALNDLDAAGVRSAVGLATANLDTQIAALPTDADVNAQADLALSDYDPPTRTELTSDIAGLNDLDAAGVRSAVGLASANLDTQIAALPTAAEIWDIQCEDQNGGYSCRETMSLLLAEAMGTCTYTAGTRTFACSDPSGTETRFTLVYGSELDGDRATSTPSPFTP